MGDLLGCIFFVDSSPVQTCHCGGTEASFNQIAVSAVFNLFQIMATSVAFFFLWLTCGTINNSTVSNAVSRKALDWRVKKKKQMFIVQVNNLQTRKSELLNLNAIENCLKHSASRR